MRLLAYVLLAFTLFACGEGNKNSASSYDANKPIVSKPIIFDSLRKALSLQYIIEHYGDTLAQAFIHPQVIVIHHTVIPTLQKTFEAFYESVLPASRDKISHASALNVSSHFAVDRDGTIYQFLADTAFARHVIGLNHCAIGIENVGGPLQPLTEAQLEANVRLVNLLTKKFPIQYLIGHHEYTAFKHSGHPLWKELDDGYLTEKNDPGEVFMRKLRKRLTHLPVLGPPGNSP